MRQIYKLLFFFLILLNFKITYAKIGDFIGAGRDILDGTNAIIYNSNRITIETLNYFGDVVSAADVLAEDWEMRKHINENRSLIEKNEALTFRYNQLLTDEMNYTGRATIFINELKRNANAATASLFGITNYLRSYLNYVDKLVKDYDRFNKVMKSYPARIKSIESRYSNIEKGVSKVEKGVKSIGTLVKTAFNPTSVVSSVAADGGNDKIIEELKEAQKLRTDKAITKMNQQQLAEQSNFYLKRIVTMMERQELLQIQKGIEENNLQLHKKNVALLMKINYLSSVQAKRFELREELQY